MSQYLHRFSFCLRRLDWDNEAWGWNDRAKMGWEIIISEVELIATDLKTIQDYVRAIERGLAMGKCYRGYSPAQL